MDTDLTVVIVNWNGGSLLRASVESVVRNPPPCRFDIVVVDNDSADDSVASLPSLPNLRVLRNRANVGFGRAANQGAATTASSYVLFLNPDAEVGPGTMETLMAAAGARPDIAASGPRIVYPDGTPQQSVWRNPPTPLNVLVDGLRLYKLVPQPWRGRLFLGAHWPHDTPRDVPMLCGAVFLVKRSAWRQIGGFDERLHLYGEDNEWCFRARRLGWKLRFEPAAGATHVVGHSSLQRWDELGKLEATTDGNLLWQRLALGRAHFAANLSTMVLVAEVERLWSAVSGQDRPELPVVVRACRRELAGLVRGRH